MLRNESVLRLCPCICANLQVLLSSNMQPRLLQKVSAPIGLKLHVASTGTHSLAFCLSRSPALPLPPSLPLSLVPSRIKDSRSARLSAHSCMTLVSLVSTLSLLTLALSLAPLLAPFLPTASFSAHTHAHTHTHARSHVRTHTHPFRVHTQYVG